MLQCMKVISVTMVVGLSLCVSMSVVKVNHPQVPHAALSGHVGEVMAVAFCPGNQEQVCVWQVIFSLSLAVVLSSSSSTSS